MSRSNDKFFMLYGSLLALLESLDEQEDELLIDEFDELLAHVMLLELDRRCL